MGIDPVCDAITLFVEGHGSLSEANLSHLMSHVACGVTDADIGKALTTLVSVGHLELRVINTQEIHFSEGLPTPLDSHQCIPGNWSSYIARGVALRSRRCGYRSFSTLAR